MSPVNDDGRGLKRTNVLPVAAADLVSPVNDDGRGLKPVMAGDIMTIYAVSPVNDDGRGLKHMSLPLLSSARSCRPSTMTGVD